MRRPRREEAKTKQKRFFPQARETGKMKIALVGEVAINYEWGKRRKNGRLRQLHVGRGEDKETDMEVFNPRHGQRIDKRRI